MDKKTYEDILKCLKYLIAATKWQNHVYAVGGCCRDSIMGTSAIKDIDLVVYLPNGGIEFAEYLHRQKLLVRKPVTYPTYGTAAFELAAFPGETIEAVQTRAEKYPDPSTRNPVTVFGTIGQDCTRRDLTINAIYWDISNERYIDVCGESFEDLENHVINTPADPDITYDDDPLRILRCVRFSAKYMWPIDCRVFESMKKNADRLSIISHERIREEILRILAMPAENARYGVKKLCECGAMKYAMGAVNLETAAKSCENDAWQYVDRYSDELKQCIRLAMLSCTSSKWTNAVDTLRLSVLQSGAIAKGSEIGSWLSKNEYNNPVVARHFVKACAGLEVLAIACACHSVLTDGKPAAFEAESINDAVVDGWLKRKLPVGGNELMAMGYSGPAVGAALNDCWNMYYEHPDAGSKEFIEFLKTQQKNG